MMVSESSSFRSILDGWRGQSTPPFEAPTAGAWFPATLPGDVRVSLMATGQIADPLVGRTASRDSWVADRDWWFARDAPSVPTGRRAFLVCRGLDYLATVFADERVLGEFEGMFTERRIPIPPGTHELRIRCAAPTRLRRPSPSIAERIVAWALRRTIGGEYYPPRFGALKCQMSFGWDFAPALPTVGVWDDVFWHETGPIAIADLAVTARPDRDDARVRLAVTLDSDTSADATIVARVAPVDDDPVVETTTAVRLTPGVRRVVMTVRVPNARRWEPWERGEPFRYRATATVLIDGERSDTASATVGVRSVRMDRPRGAPTATGPTLDHVRLIINDQPIFLRGANWVPADALLRLPPERYRALLGAAKAAGINILRVWGGGLRERRAFYDVCDELGLLVWQEFPFACAFFDRFPNDDAFLQLVEAEARGIVRAVRNHPSVVLWCGGNEFSPRRNHRVVAAIANAVAVEDGTRPFRAASPGGAERHDWRVWHGYADLATYREVTEPLLSEFGLQAAPNPASLAEFLPEPPGPAWEARNAQLDKLRRYAAPFGGSTDDRDGFSAATQRAQATALQIAIEHQRRRSGRATGVLFWQWNEPWGAVSWSVIDYAGRPKAAVAGLQSWYAPVLPSIDYPLRRYAAGDRFVGTLWLVNDTLTPLTELDCRLVSGGRELARRPAVAAANDVVCLGPVDVILAAPEIHVTVWRRGALLATNAYDLNWQDDRTMRRWDRFKDWVTWRSVR